jgi:hypothetical protein
MEVKDATRASWTPTVLMKIVKETDRVGVRYEEGEVGLSIDMPTYIANWLVGAAEGGRKAEVIEVTVRAVASTACDATLRRVAENAFCIDRAAFGGLDDAAMSALAPFAAMLDDGTVHVQTSAATEKFVRVSRADGVPNEFIAADIAYGAIAAVAMGHPVRAGAPCDRVWDHHVAAGRAMRGGNGDVAAVRRAFGYRAAVR